MENLRLLTLTSFPFRILHANQAYADLTGRKTSDVIGEPFYNLFVGEKESMNETLNQPAADVDTKKQNGPEESTRSFSARPSIATCDTPLGKFEQDVVKVRRAAVQQQQQEESSVDSTSKYTFCKIQVRPVYNFPKHPEKGLKYYAIELDEVGKASNEMLPPPSIPSTVSCDYTASNDGVDHEHKVENGNGVVYLPMPSGCMKVPPLSE